MKLTSSERTPHEGSKRISFSRPLSITNRTPSIVTDVSAMFVETMSFLTPSGGRSKTRSCSSAASDECRGSTTQPPFSLA